MSLILFVFMSPVSIFLFMVLFGLIGMGPFLATLGGILFGVAGTVTLFCMVTDRQIIRIALPVQALLLCVIFGALAVKFRTAADVNRVTFEEQVRYQVMEPLTYDFLRDVFESFASGKKIVRLKSAQAFWLSKEERNKLWPEGPLHMKAKGYTIIAKISAQPLMYGGYYDAKLVGYEKVKGKPYITK